MLLSQKTQIYTLSQIGEIIPDLKSPVLVYLYGEVGAGKTTFVSHVIAYKLGLTPQEITSPTYVYYNRYDEIVHFDLYRVHDYDSFISIGGEEIVENNTGIIFVEWPEILESHFSADIKIFFSSCKEDEYTRNVVFEYYKN